MENRKSFLEPENMKKLGFDCVSDKDGYLEYSNDATKHYNTDYNKNFPEPKGRVIIYVNFTYGKIPFVGISQDGGTRQVYHGVCETEEFLKMILYSIR
jgi:hypothetical protein